MLWIFQNPEREAIITPNSSNIVHIIQEIQFFFHCALKLVKTKEVV